MRSELTKDVHLPGENASGKGKILRVKQGYNPNSSSIGSIIFVLPAALLGMTAVFGAVSGVIMSTLMAGKSKDAETTAEGPGDE